jgi:hypothetical protein
VKLWKKIALAILGLSVVVIGAGWFYLFPMKGLESIVNRKLNALLAQRSGFQVTIGQIGGDVINGMTFDSLVVVYRDSVHEFETARASRVTVTYSISNLWHRDLRFSLVQIDSLDIHVKLDSVGKFLPRFVTTKDTGSSGSGQPPAFYVGTLVLNDAALEYARLKDTIAFDHLGLIATFQIEEGTYALDIKHLGMLSQRPSSVVKDISGKFTFGNGNLFFENLKVFADSTALELSGLVSPKQRIGSVELKADQLNLADLRKFGGPKLDGVVDLVGQVGRDSSGIRGKVDLSGTFLQMQLNQIHADFRYADKILSLDSVFGTWFDSCTLAAVGEINFGTSPEQYHADIDIAHFNLKRMVPKSFVSDLSGSVALHGSSFRNKELSLDLDVQIADSRFDVYPVQEARGKLNVTVDSISFIDSFAVRYFENWLSAAGKVEYSGEMELAVRGEIARLDHYTGDFFIKEPAGRCVLDGSIYGRTSDPSVRGTFTSDSLWLYQLHSVGVRSELDIDHFFTRPSGDLTCRFDSGTAWDIPFDSIVATMRIDSGHLLIDSLFTENAYSSLTGRGDLFYEPYPAHLRLDTLNWNLFGQRFANAGDIRVDIDSAGYDILAGQLSDGQGSFGLTGRINYNESLAAVIDLRNAQLQPWVHLFRSDLPVTALASCRLDLHGDLDHPSFIGNGTLDSLTYRDLELGDVGFGVRYSDKKMTVDSVVVRSNPGVYRAEGSFFADLALTKRKIERLPKLPMSLSISMRDTVFNLVYMFLPSVEDLEGKFQAAFNLTGSPAEPHLDGRAWITNGRLKYFDLRDTIYTDSAEVTMADNQIILDKVRAYVWDYRNRRARENNDERGKSYAILDGGLIVKSLDTLYYDVDVSLPKEFPFRYELEDIQGVAEGDLQIEGDNIPEITGDMRLISMRYQAEFAKAGEGSPLMQSLSSGDSWDIDINFDIPSNYWIKNADVDAELSGSVKMIRERGIYRFVGDMNFLRGKGYLFDKTFSIQSGSGVTFEDIESFNPRLNITAATRIPGQRRETDSTREDIELCVHVTGTLEQPQIDPCEGSPFSQGDILPLIVANYYSSDTASASGQFSQRAIDYLSRPLSQAGERGLRQLGNLLGIGVETFEIDPGYSGEIDPRKSKYTLGLSPADKLYVFGNYWGTTRGSALGFEYRFNKSFLIEGRRDEFDLYHLNLQLHWEL